MDGWAKTYNCHCPLRGGQRRVAFHTFGAFLGVPCSSVASWFGQQDLWACSDLNIQKVYLNRYHPTRGMKSIFRRFYGPIHFWSSTPSNIACFGNIWTIFKTNLSKGVIFIGSQNMCPKSVSFCFVQESEFCPYFHEAFSQTISFSLSLGILIGFSRFRVGILFDKHQVRFAHLTSVAPFQVCIGVWIWLWNWRHGSPKIYLCWLCPKKVLVVHAFWSPSLSNRFWISAVLPTESVKSVPK